MQGASCSGSDLFSPLHSPLAASTVYAAEIAQPTSSQTAAALFVLEASAYNHKGIIKHHPVHFSKFIKHSVLPTRLWLRAVGKGNNKKPTLTSLPLLIWQYHTFKFSHADPLSPRKEG